MKTKLIVIWIGLVLLAGMCLFPPFPTKITKNSCNEFTSDKVGRTQVEEGKYCKDWKPSYGDSGIKNLFLFSTPETSNADSVGMDTNKNSSSYGYTMITRSNRIYMDDYKYSVKDYKVLTLKRLVRVDYVYTYIGSIDYSRLALQVLTLLALTGAVLITVLLLEQRKELEALQEAEQSKEFEEEHV